LVGYAALMGVYG